MKLKLHILLLIIMVTSLYGCSNREGKIIDEAYRLTSSNPDSAIALLDSVNRHHLSERGKARYALAFTMAQDKSGLNVDNDSLIRIAYNWYNKRPKDTLYAKCQYYMGKYYYLQDSTERALICFNEATVSAKKSSDYLTQSMALLQSSRILCRYHSKEAISYAKDALTIFNKVKNQTISNKVYFLLNMAECLSTNDKKIKESINLGNMALKLAYSSGDSCAIADTYQDLSIFYYADNESEAALFCAKKSFSFRKCYDTSAKIALSAAYLEADSLVEAEKTINLIPRKEYSHLGYDIYHVRSLISYANQDYDTFKAYKDSSISYLVYTNTKNMAAKDNYYKLLMSKENLQQKALRQRDSMTISFIAISLCSIVIILMLTYIFKQRKKQMENKIIQESAMHQLEMDHKNTQLSAIRSYLIKKATICQKLNAVRNDESIKEDYLTAEDYEELELFLNNTDNYFVERLKKQFPNLSKKDLNFIMLIRLKLPTSVIANIYHIKIESIRQKLFLLKAKLNLENDNMSAKDFIESY